MRDAGFLPPHRQSFGPDLTSPSLQEGVTCPSPQCAFSLISLRLSSPYLRFYISVRGRGITRTFLVIGKDSKESPNPQAVYPVLSSGSCASFNRVIEIKNRTLSFGAQALALLSLLLQCIQGQIFVGSPPTPAPPFLRPLSTPNTITDITTPFFPSQS